MFVGAETVRANAAGNDPRDRQNDAGVTDWAAKTRLFLGICEPP